MKRTVLPLLLTLLLMLTALTANAQNDVRLSMEFNNEDLPSALARLEKNSSYRFLFPTKTWSLTVSEGRAVHNAPFLAIVDFLLKEKPLKYTIDGKFINISKVNNTENQTEKPKSGKLESVGGYVYDVATKEPVIGAQVRILGTNIATVTDVNGAFSFDYLLRGGESAQISYVGMKTRVVKMTKMMNIGLESDVKQVGEVVVTGIFRKAKESYTGAVSTIGKEKLEMFRGSNLLQTLKNVDASLNFPINNVAGSNPNVLPNLDIRGTSTLPMNVEEFNTNAGQTVNTPLIILDGFEISLTKLMDYNDDQIESINILKDAAATAIYGSRGANGVIVVITKQPKEGRLRVTAKAGISLQIPDLSSYHLLHAADKLRL